MVTNIKFSKFNDTPWGFRLIGGTDFEMPLTVVKVAEESLAEEAGLMDGDIVVRINDTPTSNLTHSEVHIILKTAGNNFVLGILRGGEEEVSNDPQNHTTLSTLQEGQCENVSVSSERMSMHSSSHATSEYKMESQSHMEMTAHVEKHIADETIADIMSGEAEVLKDHNVIGVNFKKIIPQSEHIKSSEVFNQLNQEAIQTKEELDKEVRKWSTFLQKPDRPIPLHKTWEQMQAEENCYKVKIVKQPQPKVAPGREPTPPPEPDAFEQALAELSEKQETSRPETSLSNQTDTRNLTDLEEDSLRLDTTDGEEGDADEKSLNDGEEQQAPKEPTTSCDNQNEAALETVLEEAMAEGNNVVMIIKSEEEIYLEKQLKEVQNQLMSLANLPFTIQAALNEVTEKLSSIVPQIAQVKEKKLSVDNTPERDEKSTSVDEVAANVTEDSIAEDTEITGVEKLETIIESEPSTIEKQKDDSPVQEIIKPVEETKPNQVKETTEKPEKEAPEIHPYHDWQYQKQVVIDELEQEHQQRLIQERTPRRPAHHAFGPQTPKERPIHLPGGRKWRNSKDAFNEEFIAEVLSSQAELIKGTTLGKQFESPLLPYDNRVNFLKYQKPEKKVNLAKSEVYRLIHHMDEEPKHGVEARPEKVVAMQDVRVS